MSERSICIVLINENATDMLDMLVGERPLTLTNVESVFTADIDPASDDGVTDIATPIAAMIAFMRRLMDEYAADPQDLAAAQLEVVSFAQEVIELRKAYARG